VPLLVATLHDPELPCFLQCRLELKPRLQVLRDSASSRGLSANYIHTCSTLYRAYLRIELNAKRQISPSVYSLTLAFTTSRTTHIAMATAADKTKPYFPLAGLADDGWSRDEEATATCFCGAVQLAFVSRGPILALVVQP
jgi:hypothetical protein